MRNYWCGNAPRTGAFVVAYIDMGLALYHFIVGLFVVAYPEMFFEEGDIKSIVFPKHPLPTVGTLTASITVSVVVTFIVFVAEVALVGVLLSAASERNSDKCDIWIKIRTVLLAIGILGFVIDLFTCEFENSQYLWLLCVVLALGVAYRLYSILIVRSFYYDIFATSGYELGLGLLEREI